MGTFEERIKPALENGTPFGEIDPLSLVDSAKEIGQALAAEDSSKSQLRKFYDSVKQIERRTLRWKPDKELSDDLIAQLLFLRPHLANAQRKNKNIERLCEALDPCLAPEVIQKKADLTRFAKFFEAIVAYAD